MFNEEIQVPYIYNAHKPSTKNYRKAMELMGTDEKNSLFVGISYLPMYLVQSVQECTTF